MRVRVSYEKMDAEMSEAKQGGDQSEKEQEQAEEQGGTQKI